MANLDVDLDEVAQSIGRSISHGEAVFVASQVHQNDFQFNFRDALEGAVESRGMARLVLRSLGSTGKPADYDRFKKLRDDSDKLVKFFWRQFELRNLKDNLRNGNALVQEGDSPTNGSSIKPRPDRSGIGKGPRHRSAHITNAEARDIKNAIVLLKKKLGDPLPKGAVVNWCRENHVQPSLVYNIMAGSSYRDA